MCQAKEDFLIDKKLSKKKKSALPSEPVYLILLPPALDVYFYDLLNI